MIHKQELRVGNWFYDKSGNPKQAIALGYETIKVLDENGCLYDDAMPITLTPEILVKCGLKLEDAYYGFRKGRYIILQMSNSFTLFLNKIESSPEIMELITGFKYLNQLQNLYFALTSEELTINL